MHTLTDGTMRDKIFISVVQYVLLTDQRLMFSIASFEVFKSANRGDNMLSAIPVDTHQIFVSQGQWKINSEWLILGWVFLLWKSLFCLSTYNELILYVLNGSASYHIHFTYGYLYSHIHKAMEKNRDAWDLNGTWEEIEKCLKICHDLLKALKWILDITKIH